VKKDPQPVNVIGKIIRFVTIEGVDRKNINTRKHV